MGIGSTVLEALLNDENFVEVIEYVPVGGTENDRVTGVSVSIRRDSVELNSDDRAIRVLEDAAIQVFSSVHADFSGVVSPQVNDKWKLPRVRGGVAVDGWMSGAPRGRDGYWEIPVRLALKSEMGGKRLERG